MERLGNEIQSEVNNIRDGRSNNETGAYYPGPLDSSSQSEEEEEEGAAARRRRDRSPGVNSDGFQRRSSSRIPIRRGGAFGGWMEDSWDYLSDSVLRNRRISNSVGAAGGDSWRPLTIRERLDIRAGLRRESERERARLARERDMSLRRMRYGELGTPGADRFPPLRELILRRLRGRGSGGDDEDELLSPSTESVSNNETRDSTRRREMLSWMVDQLSIDHESEAEQLEAAQLPGPSGAGVGARLPPRYPRTREEAREGDGTNYHHLRMAMNEADRARERERADRDNLFIRAGERRLFRDYQFMHHGPSNIALTHRIQTWDFSRGDIPDISNAEDNIVVKEAKIHNDASVDIAEDGSLLVTLVPSNLPMTTVVGLYSLRRGNLGDCYATYSLESSAVSVSLSPTSRHLLVGLTSRTSRIISLSPMDRQLMAQVFRIKLPSNSNERGRLIHRRDINQVDYGHMSLNCIRWIPVPGQGIVFATNTGLLKILR